VINGGISLYLPSRGHLSNDDCLEDERENIIRTVLCCVVYAHTYELFLKLIVGLGLGLVFVRLFRYSILWF